jgi:2-octaprenyl-3-methyl-6-methoxy-1,4-benzoquinol hydroxylase
MIGSAIALGMAKKGLSVAIVEPVMPAAYDPSQPPDMRVSAISQASEKLLKELGAWQYIQDMRLCPYRRLAVWEDPSSRTEFNAADIHTTHLGHIIENRLIQLGLHQAMAHALDSHQKTINMHQQTMDSHQKIMDSHQKVTWYTGDSIRSIEHGMPSTIVLESKTRLIARLIVGADGGNSKVRQLANIGTQGWQYRQQALGVNIKTDSIQQDITWQQFTTVGPKAFLPLYDGFGSLVWYNSAERVKYLSQLSKSALKQEIVKAFPTDLMDFEILQVAAFPLTRMHANQYWKKNIVLIGDAAHTINPLAGQGVNLGFKDVRALLDSMNENEKESLSIDPTKIFSSYERRRRNDNLVMMTAMDVLYGAFSNDNTLLSKIRNTGLKLANKAGPLKHQAMKYAMGV